METVEFKTYAPFALVAVVAYLVYAKKYNYALYVALFASAWFGYELYEKKSAEAPATD